MKVAASPNIAFIKYWGKLPATNDRDRNLATNASLSMTLNRARTTTDVSLRSSSDGHLFRINEAIASPDDHKKISAHLLRLCEFAGAPLTSCFSVDSVNNFPQGTGIASSASAFAALTIAGLGALLGTPETQRLLKEQHSALSALARRGSGSAARSLSGPFVKWDGEAAHVLPYTMPLLDTILIFSKEHKKVPSSIGHQSAQSSPQFENRLKALPKRMERLEEALKNSSFQQLGPLLELEALELHEIAASGSPAVKYLTPESTHFIDILAKLKQRNFYFTLDAGPNVHLISEQPIVDEIKELLAQNALQCEIWQDEPGFGPTLY